GNGVAERVQAAFGFGLVAVIRGEGHTRGTDGKAGLASAYDAAANAASGLIASTTNDRRANFEAGSCGTSIVDVGADFGRFTEIGEPGFGKIEGSKHFIGPGAFANIHQGEAGAISNIGYISATEAIADVIFGEQDISDLAVNVGFVVAEPGDLGS